jgi:Mg2+/Co2+ transporter CorC
MRHIPKEGEYIVESGLRFTVSEATERAILKLMVEPDQV